MPEKLRLLFISVDEKDLLEQLLLRYLLHELMTDRHKSVKRHPRNVIHRIQRGEHIYLVDQYELPFLGQLDPGKRLLPFLPFLVH
jgi:hypothetical protein